MKRFLFYQIVAIIAGILTAMIIVSAYADETKSDQLPKDYRTAQEIIAGKNIDGKAKKRHWWQFMDVAARRDDARSARKDTKGADPLHGIEIVNGQRQTPQPGQDRPTSTNSNYSPATPKQERKPVDLTEGLPPVDHPFTFAADIQKAIFDAVAAYVPGFNSLPEEQKTIVAQVNMMAAVATQVKK